jgi:hypothetical protein
VAGDHIMHVYAAGYHYTSAMVALNQIPSDNWDYSYQYWRDAADAAAADDYDGAYVVTAAVAAVVTAVDYDCSAVLWMIYRAYP